VSADCITDFRNFCYLSRSSSRGSVFKALAFHSANLSGNATVTDAGVRTGVWPKLLPCFKEIPIYTWIPEGVRNIKRFVCVSINDSILFSVTVKKATDLIFLETCHQQLNCCPANTKVIFHLSLTIISIKQMF